MTEIKVMFVMSNMSRKLHRFDAKTLVSLHPIKEQMKKLHVPPLRTPLKRIDECDLETLLMLFKKSGTYTSAQIFKLKLLTGYNEYGYS